MTRGGGIEKERELMHDLLLLVIYILFIHIGEIFVTNFLLSLT